MGLGCIMNSSNTVLPEASRYKLQFPLDFYFVIATKNGSAKGTPHCFLNSRLFNGAIQSGGGRG